MLIRLRESYAVANGDVAISVLIGDGQKGYTEVLVDGALRTSGADVRDYVLGKGTDLAGHRLRITSTVTDTNAQTNHTCVNYVLQGGVQDRTYQLEYTVQHDLDTVDYDAIFLLM